MKKVPFNMFRLSFLFGAIVMSLLITSCKKDEETPTDDEETKTFRGTKVDYSDLTETTPYNNEYFVDDNGDSTVDRTDGQYRLQMLKAIDAYAKTAANAGTATLYASTFNNMFTNTSSPFSGIYTPLNTKDMNVREATAISKSFSERDEVIDFLGNCFDSIAKASLSVGVTASAGVAGKLDAPSPSTSKYLVDAQGIEQGQVIAKSFIGAFLMDHICNVLLNESVGLTADNTEEVEGHNYTALEHNWDMAYGLLTLKQRYAQDAVTTPSPSSGGESFLGSYVWEYNKPGFPLLHMAFLKGRAAVVNNDRAEMKKQAKKIREIMEEAIANAAVGYLGKWTTGANDGARAHAIGEGLGFIYSLRFCTLNGADAEFSDGLIEELEIFEGNGFWDLTALKVNTASDAIKAKFGI